MLICNGRFPTPNSLPKQRSKGGCVVGQTAVNQTPVWYELEIREREGGNGRFTAVESIQSVIFTNSSFTFIKIHNIISLLIIFVTGLTVHTMQPSPTNPHKSPAMKC
ncbi:MAG: hypothetical protein GY943_12215 [Chloroflexi bacterium]|nr:hypothetical protein [Chloroflexota bacterium]